jgi:hypothetical protein
MEKLFAVYRHSPDPRKTRFAAAPDLRGRGSPTRRREQVSRAESEAGEARQKGPRQGPFPAIESDEVL